MVPGIHSPGQPAAKAATRRDRTALSVEHDYPLSVDPSFYVSDMKLLPTGGVEMKGLARNKDAIASFLKTLEFAGGPESGSRLFSNLAYEVQEAAHTGSGTAAASAATGTQMAGSTLNSSAQSPRALSLGVLKVTTSGRSICSAPGRKRRQRLERPQLRRRPK